MMLEQSAVSLDREEIVKLHVPYHDPSTGDLIVIICSKSLPKVYLMNHEISQVLMKMMVGVNRHRNTTY